MLEDDPEGYPVGLVYSETLDMILSQMQHKLDTQVSEAKHPGIEKYTASSRGMD